MQTYIVTTHLPAVGQHQYGVAVIITPLGNVFSHGLGAEGIAKLDDPIEYAERMASHYRDQGNAGLHGGRLVHREFTDTSATVVMVAVDFDSEVSHNKSRTWGPWGPEGRQGN